MRKRLLLGGLLLATHNAYALDSYRYLHVTIDTPWAIFLFLLGFIFLPFIMMGVLAWYFSGRKREESSETSHDQQ